MNPRLRNLAEQISPQGYAAAFWAHRFMRGYNRELLGLRRLLRPDAHIADIGAHRGLHALFFHLITRGSATIQMFEPNPSEHEHLLRLTKRYGNLHLHPLGLSSGCGSAVLRTPLLNGSPVSSRATLNPRGAGGANEHIGVDVPVRTLDEVTGTLSRRLDFIKCDVEGHELSVMRGAIQTLRSHRPVLLVELDRRHCGDNLGPTLELLEQLDYEGAFFRAGVKHPLREFDLQRDQPSFGAPQEFQRLPAEYVREFLFVPRERPFADGRGKISAVSPVL